MAARQHQIKRQILEVRGAPGMAEALYVELRRIYLEQLVPVIEACCTEVSHPDQIQRIECLELDLGRVEPRRLESELPARLRTQLKQALFEQTQAEEQAAGPKGHERKAESEVDLLAFFARSGRLPWWADASDRDLLKKALKTSIEKEARALRGLFRTLASKTEALKRLTVHFEDSLLLALCKRFFPALSPKLDTLFQSFKDHSPASIRASLRNQSWLCLLSLAFTEEGKGRASAEALLSKMLKDTASSDDSGKLKAKGPDSKTVSIAMTRQLRQMKHAGGLFSRLYAPIHLLLEHASEALQKTLLGHLEALKAEDAQAQGGPKKAAVALGDWLQFLRSGHEIPEQVLRACLAALPEAGPQVPFKTHEPANDEDEIYVDNAGLVILWPFLEHFLRHVDLLEAHRFKTPQARHRAMALLQYAATEDQQPPEYQLVLNRILCGVDMGSVLDLERPVSEAEAAECGRLLQAVIEQATILKNMSIPGFRASFLRRKGALFQREGAWLLCVERSSFDVVLERFPWSFSWIKLPWMPKALQVEW